VLMGGACLFASSHERAWTWLDRVVLSLFLWKILSHGINGWDGFSARIVLEQALYVGVYFAVRQLSADVKSIEKAADWIIAGVCIAGIYGFVQTTHGFGIMHADAGFGTRAYATLGNPDFWAGHLLLLLPMAFVRVLLPDTLSKWRNRIWVLACCLMVFSLVQSQTRSAVVALSVALPVLAYRLGKYQSIRGWFLIAVFFVAALVLFTLPNPLNPRQAQAASRFASLLNPGEAASGRFMMAKIALKAGLEKPILGWGSGRYTQAHLLAQGAFLQLPSHQKEPYRFTHDAHCDLLQVFVETGFVGLILFGVMLGLAFHSAWNHPHLRISAMLLAGMSGVLVHGLFHFPLSVVPTTAFFYAFMAWSQTGKIQKEARRFQLMACSMVLGGGMAAFVFTGILEADMLYHRGMNAKSESNMQAALPWLNAAVRIDRNRPELFADLGQVQTALGDLPAAEKSFRTSLACGTTLPEAYAGLGLVLGRQGRFQEAGEALGKAIDLNPRAASSWGNLGKVKWGMKDTQGAEAAYQHGVENAPDWVEGWWALAQMARARGDKLGALNCLKKVLVLQPDHAAALQWTREIL
jgi:Tfp pilus assembly protein PilF